MKCEQTRALLELYTDGELGPEQYAGVEEHLRGCEACRNMARSLAERSDVISSRATAFRAPPGFERQILDALGREAEAGPAAARRSMLFFPLPAWGMAAAAAVMFAVGFSWSTHRAASDRLADEAVADHLRSLQADHLMDVVSTDQHTVKPWFTGKLEFSPPVRDLASSGFPLVGGRLDRIDGKTAAALVFRRGKHVINVIIWPSPDSGTAQAASSREGFNIRSWSKDRLSFLAVSDVSPEDLEAFSKLYEAGAP